MIAGQHSHPTQAIAVRLRTGNPRLLDSGKNFPNPSSFLITDPFSHDIADGEKIRDAAASRHPPRK